MQSKWIEQAQFDRFIRHIKLNRVGLSRLSSIVIICIPIICEIKRDTNRFFFFKFRNLHFTYYYYSFYSPMEFAALIHFRFTFVVDDVVEYKSLLVFLTICFGFVVVNAI